MLLSLQFVKRVIDPDAVEIKFEELHTEFKIKDFQGNNPGLFGMVVFNFSNNK